MAGFGRVHFADAPIWVRAELDVAPITGRENVEYDLRDGERSIAVFSGCGKYRYFLMREWDVNTPTMTYVMLNPSTADAFKNDPTVARCEERARRCGFGSFIVANIFAYRSTEPTAITLKTVEPIGEGNDAWIEFAVKKGKQVILGWGNHGKFRDRGNIVVAELEPLGKELFCLGQNKGGAPVHPLYQAFEKPLVRYIQSVL